MIKKSKSKRVKVPTTLQMEAVECGAASLGRILSYYGKSVPIEEIRVECGVSRDGTKASNILKAAAHYGLIAEGYRKEPEQLRDMEFPLIIHWNFNHFVVLEGFKGKKVYINDPASGRKVVSYEEFDQSFTGIVLQFEKNKDFKKQKNRWNLLNSIISRIGSSKEALFFLLLISILLIFPGILLPVFTKIFVDSVLLKNMKNWVGPLLIGIFSTMIFRNLLIFLKQYVLLRLETKIALVGSMNFFWHILKLPVDFFNQRFSGEIGDRIMTNDSVASILSGKIGNSILDIISIIFYLILMAQYDITLTLIGIIIAIINIGALIVFSNGIKDKNIKYQQDSGKLIGVEMGGINLIETIKAGGLEADFFQRWSGYHAKLLNSQQELGKRSLLLFNFPNLLSVISVGIILVIGGSKVMNGEMTLGILVAYQSLMASFLTPVVKLVELGNDIETLKADLSRLDDVYNYKIIDNKQDFLSQFDKNEDILKLNGYLDIKDLTFGYNKLEEPLIKNFSLSLS
ncbi:MAG TPA: cysteine peptidase family C39 domain-containing protein, partial [Spirochaetota bacterium]|nr:cysteine peptidase family C39 domain-containing protein [Spirochaetota bacterium]